jgi:hypothetical protein
VPRDFERLLSMSGLSPLFRSALARASAAEVRPGR